jgi:hypothetical protein
LKEKIGLTRPRLVFLADSILLFVLAALLIKPLFRVEYLDKWASIDGALISDARMVRDNLPHPGWLPLWYGGTRFDYIYPPGLLYGTALISKFAGVSPARAYHFYTAMFYTFGIVAVYWLVRAGSGSRGGALLAAAGTALLSPSFLLLRQYRLDSPLWVPQRLHALVTYGEGPHISALAILPAALAASFFALRRRHAGWLALAAILCALVVANNFYGATALAIFFPILVWSVWLGDRDRTLWLRAAGLAALAYGLCAVWLTPSYLKITLMNLRWLPSPGNASAKWAAALAVLLFAGVSWRFARGRPDRIWAVFVAGSALMFSFCVLAFAYFGLPMLGDPGRLVPELDLVLILAFVEVILLLWKGPRLRIAAVGMALVFFYPSMSYLRHAYAPFSSVRRLDTQYPYRIAKWVHDNLPGERTLSTGAVRLWYDTWFDNAQPDGGSLQGMLNQIWPVAIYQLRVGDRPELSRLWLQAFGVDAVVVPDKTSPEPYHDFEKPEKFRAAFSTIYDDKRGTVIYRVPRSAPGIGRIIDSAQLAAVGPIRGGDDFPTLSRYVAVVEDARRKPAQVTWHGFDSVDIQATVSRGEAILMQETYDPSWRAYENGQTLPIKPDPTMGFMIVDVPPGAHHIEMRFETPLANRVGLAVTLLSCVLAALLLCRGFLWFARSGAHSL